MRCLVVTSVALALSATPAALGAQIVSGTITLEERPGSEGGDVRTAVVYLEPRGAPGAPADARLRTARIAMRGREFIPRVSIVQAGGTASFPNEDPFSHNVFSNVELGPFDLGLYRRGATRSARFARTGVYPIYCNIHSKMVTFVVAVPGAWAAHPDANGRFVLRDVPAGTYVLHVWHERAATETTRELAVTPSGISDLPIVVDARTYVDAPHLNKFGRPYAVIRADRY